jgi:hypothetical protein
MVEKVIAQVVLKASNGSSVLDSDPESVVIDDVIIAEASKKLRTLGCDVIAPGIHSLSISCEKQLFEEIFQTSLERIEAPKAAAIESFFRCRGPVKIPDSLIPYVAGVLLPEPPGLDL